MDKEDCHSEKEMYKKTLIGSTFDKNIFHFNRYFLEPSENLHFQIEILSNLVVLEQNYFGINKQNYKNLQNLGLKLLNYLNNMYEVQNVPVKINFALPDYSFGNSSNNLF